MRVIGIDPGIVTTGYGVVEEVNHRLVFIASGSISTSAAHPISRRLKKIHDELTAALTAHRPAVMAVEDTFVAKNFQSALKLGQARGIALLAGEQFGLPVFECTPTEVKLAVCGYGAARKDQVQNMVGRLLRLTVQPDSHHAADALAVAICHLHAAKIKALTGVPPAARAGSVAVRWRGTDTR
ncbi:MAG TPA: crossover junction endodeoxyribonuclease RuvC [Nitrospiria bacterium]